MFEFFITLIYIWIITIYGLIIDKNNEVNYLKLADKDLILIFNDISDYEIMNHSPNRW